MQKIFSCVIAAAFLTLTNAAFAASQTVTLDVPGMTCALCPISVKKALLKVPGVSHTEVSYEAKQAVVTYDDAKTNTAALTKASTNAGYPATVKR